MKLTSKQAQPFAKVAFPRYTGRKFTVTYTRRTTIYNTNWDGGSKNDYVAISVNTLESKTLVTLAPWQNVVEGKEIDIPAGMMLVCHSKFCGKDMGLEFFVNPMDAPMILKAG